MDYKNIEDIWSQESVQEQIKNVLKTIGSLLIEKNRKYGNSAICPKRIFSTADAEEQIKVRLDDKLSRIANHQDDDNEDPILDSVGYMILLMVLRNLKAIEKEYKENQAINGITNTPAIDTTKTVISD
jgi:hypothetical protein